MSVVRYRNPSEVIAFLETLDLTPGRLITAHELLAALAFEKQYPTDAARLETLLAPVLCSNETETRQFQRRFREWVEPPPPVAPPPQAQPLWRRPRRLSWKSISRVTILVLAVTLSHAPVPESLPRATSGLETSPDAASFRRPPAEVSQVGFVVSGARAVEKAVLWYRGTHDALGPWRLLHASGAAGVHLSAARDAYAIRGAAAAHPHGGATGRHPGKSESLVAGPANLRADDRFTCTAESMTGCARGRSRGGVIRWCWLVDADPRDALSAVGDAAQIGVRESGLGQCSGHPVPVRGYAACGRPSAPFAPLRPRRFSRRAHSSPLHGTGGYFSPVYRWRTGIPAYVALIRRVSPRDQLAAFHEVLVRRLREYQVRIETFYFREDPSICFSRDGAAYPLERVASRFPAHALFVFCEPEQFRNPERVGPAAWLAAATAAWEDVVLLVQRADFGAAAHTRLPIFEPTLVGLESWAAGDPARAPSAPEYPPTLQEFSEAWLEEQPQSVRAMARLSAELRHYLGDEGYLCLAACAIYPAMFWELTMWCALRLIRDHAACPDTVRRLVMLPWFRHNSMPDWLRQRFVAGLSDFEEARVRAVLNEFQDRPADAVGGVLEVVTGKRPSDRPRRIRDYVFLSFLLGWKPDRLSIRPPGRFRRLLLALGIAWQPLMAVLPAAIALAAAAAFASYRWMPVTPSIEFRARSPVPPHQSIRFWRACWMWRLLRSGLPSTHPPSLTGALPLRRKSWAPRSGR